MFSDGLSSCIHCSSWHQNSSPTNFSTALNGKLEYLASQNIEVVVMGDINIDLIKYNVHQFINDYLDDRKALFSQLV